jgi:hypothetical protein
VVDSVRVHVAAGEAVVRPRREPNCIPGDPVDGPGLVHDWKHISEDGPGDVYRCPRCGQTDYD